MISVVIRVPVDWLRTSQTELKRDSCIHKYTYKESDIFGRPSERIFHLQVPFLEQMSLWRSTKQLLHLLYTNYFPRTIQFCWPGLL